MLILTLLVGNQNYNGTGINIIEQCIDGTVRPEAFFMKMLFTALTLGAGFKGGEIVPSFLPGRHLAVCLETCQAFHRHSVRQSAWPQFSVE